MLWHENKLISIHIPKTGGSSVEQLCYRHSLRSEPNSIDMRTHYCMGEARRLCGEEFPSYRAFIIVRSPWERVISLYLYAYSHNRFGNFPNVPEFSDGNYVTFPEFYHTIDIHHHFAEDFFSYCELDGAIPDNLHIIDFNNLAEEFIEYTGSIGIEFPEPFPHENKNPIDSEGLRDYFRADPEFIEVIGEKYKREIEYFGFDPPIK